MQGVRYQVKTGGSKEVGGLRNLCHGGSRGGLLHCLVYIDRRANRVSRPIDATDFVRLLSVNNRSFLGYRQERKGHIPLKFSDALGEHTNKGQFLGRTERECRCRT